MATYIPGVNTYIEQFQPYQPDYNFLGNVLQTKQSQYDANYKALSQKYGTLLNSDMLRTDNIEKRNEFFKMIDNDIKRISGLDLSLQQNTDAANKVFDSFFQNKDMIHDMNYTREYQKQLQAGQVLRNCLDPKTCGGKKYWDVGTNALHYRADEYKKASKDEAMKMSPGRYVAQVDIQEKTTNFLKDLIGKEGGPFGVEKVTLTPDGKYQIKTKYGTNMLVPFTQLVQAMYSDDQDVIDMFNTQAYVQRKGYVQQNLERFQGDEDAAENDYFQKMENSYQESYAKLKEVQDLANTARNKVNILADEIKKKGTNGKDKLYNDYKTALADLAVAEKLIGNNKVDLETAKSFFQEGDDINTKRLRADSFIANSLKDKTISESAIRAVANTGTIDMKEDQYALKYYDYSLDMKKLAAQYSYMDRNNRNKAIYDLNAKVAFHTFKEQYKKKGNAVGPSNEGTYIDGTKGTTSTEEIDENKEIVNKYLADNGSVKDAANNYTTGYANTLMGILNDDKASQDQREYARQTLASMYGVAQRDNTGKVTKQGFDPKKNVFIDANGIEHSNAKDIVNDYQWKSLFDKTKSIAETNKNIATHAQYLEGEGAQIMKAYDQNTKMLTATEKLWFENNKSVHKYGRTKMDGENLEAWNMYVTDNGRVVTQGEFTKKYLQSNPYKDADDAVDAYEEMSEAYNKFYNQGTSIGTDKEGKPVPLVRPVNSNAMFNRFGGGRSAGGSVRFQFDSESPASLGTRGLNTFYNDAQDTEAIWTIGNHDNKNEALSNMEKNGNNAKAAMDALIQDLRSGNLTKTEKDIIVGQIDYMDVALSDRNMVGATIKLPESYLKKHKGKGKTKTWADDPRFATEGISMYVPKAKANNDFTKAFTMSPNDIILETEPITLSDPYAGTLTIQPRNSDGTFSVTGDIGGYNANGEWVPVPGSKIYGANVGGNNIVNALNVYLKQVGSVNKAYHDGVRTDKIYDLNKLPELQSYLKTLAGGDAAPQEVDVNKIFMQGISSSLFQQR